MRRMVYIILRRILVLVLLLALLAGAVPATEAWVNPFSDVAEDAWYYPAVRYANRGGLLLGVSGRRFGPEETMTRAMLVTVLWRYCGQPDAAPANFRDVPAGTWYSGAVAWAAESGVAGGVGHGRFEPDEPVTREQATVILYRFAAVLGRVRLMDGNYSGFTDAAAVSPWAVDAMRWAVGTGMIAGLPAAQGRLRLAPQGFATRAQTAMLLMRFLEDDASIPIAPDGPEVTQLQYGTSGSGQYPLTACKIGSGRNVMVLTFAVHGWEDNFDRDGEELLYLADLLQEKLLERYELIEQGDWTVYILRCVNPDGLYRGVTCNGPGRCTTTCYNSDGTISTAHGIDINRCFPYAFTAHTNRRNYTGDAPLQCAEAQALARFTRQVRGEGRNLCIDTHGWLNQIITSGGYGEIYQAFHARFPSARYTDLRGCGGFYSAWAAFVEGYDACLFELPADVTSHAGFVASGYPERYCAAILDLLGG